MSGGVPRATAQVHGEKRPVIILTVVKSVADKAVERVTIFAFFNELLKFEFSNLERISIEH